MEEVGSWAYTMLVDVKECLYPLQFFSRRAPSYLPSLSTL